MEENFGLASLSSIVEAVSAEKYILENFRANPKPNLTQYQLALMETKARAECFRELREYMEKSFKLQSLSEIVDVLHESAVEDRHSKQRRMDEQGN